MLFFYYVLNIFSAIWQRTLKIKNLIVLLTVLFFTTNYSYAEEPKILEYNKEDKTIKVEIEGKEYTLPIPEEKSEVITDEEKNKDLQPKRKEYAKGPPSAEVTGRVYNIPTDALLRKNGLRLDFTHRFSSPIREETANDVYGLDSFSYTGIGLYYGITDFLEAHAFRSSLTDASEVGIKLRLLREAKTLGKGSPVGLTFSGGFQNDNIQDGIDFYVQPILTKVIIPKWAKLYLAPTWAEHSSTIASPSSLSASFSTFLDPKKRKYSKEESTFSLPFGGVLQIVPDRLSLFGEYIPVLAGYKEVENGWAFGLQILSPLETHVWTLGISNVPYSTFGQFVVGGPSNDWFLGFNISAKIK